MNAHAVAYVPQQIPPHAFYNVPSKGTLQPGTTIQIQSLTVTVERFLSQGGFAHVYLVRSATPVNGTHHHVLKRMLVADHGMLQEVRNEVDIMRLLKGHANIVNLIDSASNRLPDGRYEVFILMEYCAGGGIIDMMNRRLRERLTEGEILQIFVDVCEGVAAMHNLQPPLLHRDLKVENILQANETSYKLCDFGSATAVSKPPTTAAEVRALENDLNRHTTLQYRAPEMVDPQLRRPIDEKSDVWALGVLLYKLCYYTTPFEEHGPLAILNVQYKIPPYPVYSQAMITMIMSILREHGTQRPTVFELLDTVHRLRGTKSRYRYNQRPAPPAPTLPRSPQDIVFRSPLKPEPSATLNKPSTVTPTIAARQAALDAAGAMRRGRLNGPAAGVVGDSTILHAYADDLDVPTPKGGHFKHATTTEKWSSAREAPAALGGGRPNHQPRPSEEWIPQNQNQKVSKDEPKKSSSPWDGLGSLDNSERGTYGFGDFFDPTQMGARQTMQNVSAFQNPLASSPGLQQQPPPASAAQQSRFTMPTPSRLLSQPRPPIQSSTKPSSKDSFEGLMASSMSPPSTSAPTQPNLSLHLQRPPSNASQNGLVSAFSRPSTAADSIVSTGTGVSSVAVVEGSAALSAAERFPSIEQLELGNRERAAPPAAPMGPRAPSPIRPQHANISLVAQMANRPPTYAGLSKMSYTGGLGHDHDVLSPPPAVPMSGVRSQQVTGTAMKGAIPPGNTHQTPSSGANAPGANAGEGNGSQARILPPSNFGKPSAISNRFPVVERPPSRFPTAERPLAPRRGPTSARKRSNASEVKADPVPPQQQEYDLLGPSVPGTQSLDTRQTPSPSTMPQKDWLMDDDLVLSNVPKSSTGAMAPRLPTPDPGFVDPNKAKRVTMGTSLVYNVRAPGALGNILAGNAGPEVGAIGLPGFNKGSMDPPPPGWQRHNLNQATPQTQMPLSPPNTTRPSLPRQSSQEGPQIAGRRRSNTASRASQDDLPPPQLPPRLAQPQFRTASPQPAPQMKTSGAQLSDNWSPIERNFPPAAMSSFGETQTGADSSGEEGPEDVGANTLQQMRLRSQAGRVVESPFTEQRKDETTRRQGSVHELVDLWSNGRSPVNAIVQRTLEDVSARSGHQKAPTRDLINFSSDTQETLSGTFNRVAHLLPPKESIERRTSPSSGSASEKDTDAPSIQPKRHSAQRFKPGHISIERTRPQSLFISPGPASAPHNIPQHSPDDSLSVPSGSGNISAGSRQRTPRRGSISDMVSRYEALSVVSSTASGYTASTESGPSSPKPKPHISMKPAALRAPGLPGALPVVRRASLLKSPIASAASPHGPAPTFPSLDAAASAVQKEVKMNQPVKMRTSPLLFKSLDSPTEPTTTQPHVRYSKDRDSTESYQPRSQGLQPPATAPERTPSPNSNADAISDANDDILLVSPRPRVTHQPIEHRSEPAKAKTPPPHHSPSPEAYKGVGRLIDQWQKKTEEAQGQARKPGGPRQQRKDILPGRFAP